MRCFPPLCLGTALALSGCAKGPGDAEVQRAVEGVNVIDESNLNDIMMTVADPDEAVSYFRDASAQNPGRVAFQRGLAASLVRANRPAEAVPVWDAVANGPDGTESDRVEYAGALIRANEWDRAAEVLASLPPGFQSYERARLEAMVADSRGEWHRADSLYETARGLAERPAGVLNNWGFSKLTRGDAAGAERLLTEALRHDPTLFTAKNNLVLARGAQRKYDLPVIGMTQRERAELLYTLALAAIKQGDVGVGKSMLRDAVETHPQFFEAAQRSLDALENGATAG
jgi:hypothetical protein